MRLEKSEQRRRRGRRLAAAAAGLACVVTAGAAGFSARVLRVIDGDSLWVESSAGESREIRVEGIDCPEAGQPFADEARAFTVSFVEGRALEVDGAVADEYGRLVARIRADGRDLSRALVRAGLGWHFKRYSHDATLASAEDEARAAHRGLWSESSPVAPWDLRASRRTAARAPASGAYVGNVRSHLFHRKDCKNASCPNCVRGFDTREAALAAGYHPAHCCHP